MRTITRDELQKLMHDQLPPLIVDVLPLESFHKQHLPGALNIPFDEHFDDHVRAMVSDMRRRLVVVCQTLDCTLSEEAARRLDELGYEDVLDYAAGMTDWLDAGLPVEGERVASQT